MNKLFFFLTYKNVTHLS